MRSGRRLRQLGKQSVKQFFADDMTTYAAAFAYHVLFALFPFVIFLVALLGFLNIPGFFDWLLQQARSVLPQTAMERIEEVIGQVRDGDGGLLSFGIIVALWAASAGIRSLMNALNAAYSVEESRPAWKRYPLSVIYTIGLAVMVVTATALMLVGPQVVGWLASQVGLSSFFVALWTWLRIPVGVLLLMLAVAITYKVVPNVSQPFRFVAPGAVLAVAVWAVASLVFSYYVSNIADYSAMYGSLGAVIALLFYFFITAAVVLLGAELNAVAYRAFTGNENGEDNG